MNTSLSWKPFVHAIPVCTPLLVRNRNELVPFMAVLESKADNVVTVLGKDGKRTEQVSTVTAIAEYAEPCPGVKLHSEWRQY